MPAKFKKYAILLALFFLLSPSVLLAENSWGKVINLAKPSVVMIEIELLAKLENETPGCYQATGFIVDAKNGLILTNRHVTTVGPATARATFWNKEKIEIKSIYYDPVHDFGFYKFDPSLLRWTKPEELKLADSDKARAGEAIRVLGNNASEGFSILEGTVSRVKKNAPAYSDPDTYRDLNTYYFQTSADVSGGSSGGPIINEEGKVLAINSSSKRFTAVSWGLPINLVKGALKSIQRGESIDRGDVGARVIFSAFDELIDYGFPKKLITILKRKRPNIEGLLTVKETLNQSDASSKLKPADVIWEVEGQKIEDDFSKYEKILNSKVGEKINIKVIRDGKSLDFKLEVIDLEKIKLKSFVRIGYDYFTPVPLFLAYSYNVPIKGVFTPSIKYNFSEKNDFPQFLIITELGNKKISDIGDFIDILKKAETGDKLKISYKILKEDHREEQKVIQINWKWFKPDYFTLSDKEYDWKKVY